ncbi:MAG: transcriptional repressor [Erysipelotrichaceae bacterium]|nr:transcriptional repressor [Erysipelotrichaceae bacterium]
MTKLQRVILNTVLDSDDHLSAEQVYLKVKKKMPTVALGSIYRNLNTFAKDGKIRRIVATEGPDLYEGNTTPHNHIVCVRCGKMSDLFIDEIYSCLEEYVDTPIIRVDLIVNSVCPKCQNN